ncbi:hypothetical protein [Acetanaerobacterium elongatum]|uniref:FlgN protein n=1 Tax=Acetanaerobacterium elongatum TaxID=258515 RepID=A0A1H0AVU1_9FIRM|nr:hypothetical protein [Acetanaerobacterium elongatum]SDN37326.1 hypothetical protein SAMN05192585_11754 [Acetanaerobacterium elongatum]
MKISDQDIAALNEHLTYKLNQMRIYHSLTVALLNNEIDQYGTFLDERQHIIDEVNAANLRIKRCLSAEDASLKAIEQAMRGKEAKVSDPRFNAALKLTKQIYELINDIALLDKKLILKTEEKKNGMLEELKGMSGQRKVVDTLYFTGQNPSIGKNYDIKR